MQITGICVCGRIVQRRFCSESCKRKTYLTEKPTFGVFNPPSDWDKSFELKPESSEYYPHLVKAYGQAMADYYWNRRYNYEVGRDSDFTKICKEISEKCDIFLKSRGVQPFKIY